MRIIRVFSDNPRTGKKSEKYILGEQGGMFNDLLISEMRLEIAPTTTRESLIDNAGFLSEKFLLNIKQAEILPILNYDEDLQKFVQEVRNEANRKRD